MCGCIIYTVSFSTSIKIPAISQIGLLLHKYGTHVGVYGLDAERLNYVAGTQELLSTDGDSSGQTLTSLTTGVNKLILIYN